MWDHVQGRDTHMSEAELIMINVRTSCLWNGTLKSKNDEQPRSFALVHDKKTGIFLNGWGFFYGKWTGTINILEKGMYVFDLDLGFDTMSSIKIDGKVQALGSFPWLFFRVDLWRGGDDCMTIRPYFMLRLPVLDFFLQRLWIPPEAGSTVLVLEQGLSFPHHNGFLWFGRL